jgi:hypothetical protein
MQKWEYIVQQFQSPSELSTLLNKLGDEGWELVTLLAEGTPTYGQGQIVAKRPEEKAWSRPDIAAKGE